MNRVFNFSAGPSQMPEEVLAEARLDLMNYKGCGMSVMEMSHRSPMFQEIIDSAEETLRRIMNIPEDYAVLFLQGGASTQFSMVPMNLAKRGETTAYALTGNFSNKAMQEAARWGNAVAVTSSKEDNYSFIPRIFVENIPKDAKYLHITGNNTIFGTTYYKLPQLGNIPLVADWSSAMLGKEIDVTKYALIYAGAQKNMGPAGLTVVIMKKALLENEIDNIVPTMLQYKIHAKGGSMYNTPPCWSIYMAKLMFEWVENQGGVSEMEKRNCRKSAMLYEFIDNSAMFRNPVRVEDRSIMNVVFTLPNEELTAAFLKKTQENGLENIKGHKLVGGCRASLYNGMPLEGVEKLIKVMKEFEKENG